MSVLTMNGIVNVIVELSPRALNVTGFNSGLIIGKSPVINPINRVVEFSTLEQMLEYGFTTSMPEYKAAQLYFGATKKPERVFIGVKTGAESYTEAAMACRSANSNWYGFTACDATKAEVLALGTFAESTSPYTTYFYTSPFIQPEFDLSYSGAAGNFAEDDTNGKITVTFDVIPTTDPVASEFTVTLAGNVIPTTFEYNDVIGQVILRFTPVPEDIDISIFTEMKAKGFFRSHGMYSGQANAVSAVMGFAMGANTQTANSAYTLAYKSLPGVTTSEISENLISQIKKENGNVYVQRGGKYNVYEQGVQSNGAAYDDLIGVDTLANNVQATVMNLFTSVNKVGYTNDGVSTIINAITPDFETAVATGFIAAGRWTGKDIVIENKVALAEGEMLPRGYALFAANVDSMSQVTRENRIAPPIYCPVKLSGAIEHIVIQIPVNR